jgi:hypothetical protein
MNPARSIAPALVSGNLHALWLYIAAPLVGAALAALTYQFIRGEETQPAGVQARDRSSAESDRSGIAGLVGSFSHSRLI